MTTILRAYTRAVRSLLQRSVLAHFLWPMLVATAAWVTIGILFWERLARIFAAFARHYLPLAAARRDLAEHALATSLKIALYLMSIPLTVVTTIFLVEIVALPFILDHVSKRDYPYLEVRHGGSQWQSLRNTLLSSAIAAAITIVALPLWLLPGIGVVISLALSAWLNYRSFRYDVLMKHADAVELVGLPASHRKRLLLLSLGASLISLVPGAILFAVPFVGLSFVHYLLPALERSREQTVHANLPR